MGTRQVIIRGSRLGQKTTFVPFLSCGCLVSVSYEYHQHAHKRGLVCNTKLVHEKKGEHPPINMGKTETMAFLKNSKKVMSC